MSVAPAGDKTFVKGEVPAAWVDDENRPVNIAVNFTFGVADVDDELGRYLVARGLAKKTRILETADEV
jgi:hypothetical protein